VAGGLGREGEAGPCVELPVWLKLAAGFTFAFLYLPLVVVVVYSFNDSRLNAEWVGFTLDWYRVLFADEEMLLAARNSLFIALVPACAPPSWAPWRGWPSTATTRAGCRCW
jgi:ABC-type spermidine/putrescine transport system permease subunit I